MQIVRLLRLTALSAKKRTFGRPFDEQAHVKSNAGMQCVNYGIDRMRLFIKGATFFADGAARGGTSTICMSKEFLQ